MINSRVRNHLVVLADGAKQEEWLSVTKDEGGALLFYHVWMEIEPNANKDHSKTGPNLLNHSDQHIQGIKVSLY